MPCPVCNSTGFAIGRGYYGSPKRKCPSDGCKVDTFGWGRHARDWKVIRYEDGEKGPLGGVFSSKYRGRGTENYDDA